MQKSKNKLKQCVSPANNGTSTAATASALLKIKAPTIRSRGTQTEPPVSKKRKKLTSVGRPSKAKISGRGNRDESVASSAPVQRNLLAEHLGEEELETYRQRYRMYKAGWRRGKLLYKCYSLRASACNYHWMLEKEVVEQQEKTDSGENAHSKEGPSTASTTTPTPTAAAKPKMRYRVYAVGTHNHAEEEAEEK